MFLNLLCQHAVVERNASLAEHLLGGGVDLARSGPKSGEVHRRRVGIRLAGGSCPARAGRDSRSRLWGTVAGSVGCEEELLNRPKLLEEFVFLVF